MPYTASGYQYRCRVTDSDVPAQTGTSVVATLTVYEHVTIDSQPSSVDVIVDDRIDLVVVASGGWGALSYQWYFDDGTGFSAIAGATAATYTVVNTALTDQGDYYCEVSDTQADVVQSDTVTVTVLGITTQPTGGSYAPGDNHTFSVAASGGSGIGSGSGTVGRHVASRPATIKTVAKRVVGFTACPPTSPGNGADRRRKPAPAARSIAGRPSRWGSPPPPRATAANMRRSRARRLPSRPHRPECRHPA